MPPTFRIWSPDNSPDTPSTQATDSVTLREAFERYLAPTMAGAKPSTLNEYTRALDRWETLTGDPEINDIDCDVLDAFRSSALNIAAATTCNKWFRHLRAVLNHLGPRATHSKRARRNRGILTEVPLLDDLPEAEPDPVEMTDAQISACYFACESARWPREARTGCSPAHWWQASLVLLVNYGMRRDDWLHLPRNAVSFDRGTFTFTAKKTGKRHDLVLNDVVRLHLQRITNSNPTWFTPTSSNRELYRAWHAIQASAGVRREDGLPFGFHDLRQTCAARFNDHSPGTAEMLLGHALPRNAKVTARSYLGKRRLRPLWNAIKTIPQPAAFKSIQHESTDHQRRLFD